jgi:lambda family phage portal protein
MMFEIALRGDAEEYFGLDEHGIKSIAPHCVQYGFARQIANMRELQAAAINARLFFGDIGFVITGGGQLQPIEGQCINTPNDLVSDDLIVDGVRLNSNGIKTNYYVTKRDRRNGRADTSKYESVSAVDMIFCRAPSWRVDQVRGIPEIAPVIPLLHDINDLQQRMLERARAEASNIAVITSEEGAARGQMLGDRGARGKDTAQVSQPVEHIGRRKTHYLRTGETLQIPDITAPGADHVTYRKALLESVAATLRLPAQFVSLVFDSSFSGGRLGPILAHHTFAQWERWLVDSMLQRTWNWRIAKAIKDGDLPPAPVDERGISEWYKVEWFGQAHEWIDPQAQAAADREKFRLGTVSMTDIVKKMSGRDFRTVLNTKARDIREAVEVAAELTKATGVELKWTDLIDASTSMSKSAEATKDNSQEFENTEGLEKWLK